MKGALLFQMCQVELDLFARRRPLFSGVRAYVLDIIILRGDVFLDYGSITDNIHLHVTGGGKPFPGYRCLISIRAVDPKDLRATFLNVIEN